MRKFILFLGCLSLFIISCKKETKIPGLPALEEQQARPVCGLDELMSKMTPEMRTAMMSSAMKTENQSSELLMYLDFDGALVRQGFPNPSGMFSTIISGTRNCPPPSLTAQQKLDIADLVKDDYSPFNIIVTTDAALFNSYPTQFKQICIITTFPSVIGFGSGIAGVSPFAGPGFRMFSNPCFVFANLFGGNTADIAGVVSHETGHTMGLDHQNLFNETCGFLTEYHPGFGTGPTSFVPIMGISSNKRITNWYGQDCPSHSFGHIQDDFQYINDQVVLKEDDFPDSPSGSNRNTASGMTGVLEKDGDVDFISINFKNPGSVTVSSDNMDLKVSVYNNGGHLMAEYNDPNDIGVTIPSVNGKRYLKIEAAGNVNMPSRFMTGQYKIIY